MEEFDEEIDAQASIGPVHQTPAARVKEFMNECAGMSCEQIEERLRSLEFGAGIDMNKPKAIRSNLERVHDLDMPVMNMAADARKHLEEATVFDSDGAIGKVFSKVHAKGTVAHEVYNANRDYASKDKYKTEWLDLFLKELTIGKEHSKGHEHIDKSKGRYLNFGTLVESYGIAYNRELAIKRATLAATKCVMMKGEWLSYDALGDCTEYLRLDKEFADELREKWNMYERSEEPAADGESVGPGDEPGAKPRRAPSQMSAADRATKAILDRRGVNASSASGSGKGNDKVKAKVKSKKDNAKRSADHIKKEGGGGGDEDAKKSKKKKLDEMIAAATKIKKDYTKYTNSYQQIASSLNGKDPTWAADKLGKDNVNEMNDSYSSLEDDLSLFDREFLMKEPKECSPPFPQRELE